VNHDALANASGTMLAGMLEDQAKNWLAHDGLWFQAVERHFGMAMAIELDREVWAQFARIEARRIVQRHEIPPRGGIAALAMALAFRLYAHLNRQSTHQLDDRTLRLEMNECRVQATRTRKGLAPFPCKTVGIAEYANFAHAVDPRIRTRPIACPPDPRPDDFYCAWLFTVEDDPIPEGDILAHLEV
jgi:hypothetical protein